MRLPRPHIPISVKLAVAARQIREHPEDLFPASTETLVSVLMTSAGSPTVKLKALLAMLRTRLGAEPDDKLELHHDPALMNREKVVIAGAIVAYKPDANDHHFLKYMIAEDHDIVTRVRGEGAQLSDQAQQRKNKRIAERRGPPGIVAIVGKRKKRPRGRRLRSANRWPPRGSRKVNWRSNNARRKKRD